MGKQITTEKFIEKAKSIHPNYNYNKTIYINNRTPLTISCYIHGDFNIIPWNFLSSKFGCPRCGFDSKIGKPSKNRLNTSTFIERAKKERPEYIYDKTVYTTARNKVIITCPKHGDFKVLPLHFLEYKNWYYCPICKPSKPKKVQSQEDFIREVEKISPEYNYSRAIYKKSRIKVEVICNKHGSFYATPNDLLKGTGCPKCSESKGETAVRNWFEKHNISYKRQQRFADLGLYSYDFYLPTYNILIEYNGEQHYNYCSYFHKDKKDFQHQLERDQLKKEYAEKNGYKLLVIPYTDFDNIESILEKNILPSA